jgi:hypothetical protein
VIFELERRTMSEPQLSIRSAKARDLAHALARRTGQPINKLVEQALERYDHELRQQTARYPIDAVWDLAAEGRRAVPAGTTSAHDDLYDEHGLPR